jgi:hypothetical protein
VVTHKELAEAAQERSGLHTKQRVHYWIDDVLAAVSRDCASRGEPLLSALCVNREGSVGAAYGALVLELTGETPEDPDDHAAKQRLACHQFFEVGPGSPAGQCPHPGPQGRRGHAPGEDVPHLPHAAAAHRGLRHLRLTGRRKASSAASVQLGPDLVGHHARGGQPGLALVAHHGPLGRLRERAVHGDALPERS